MTDDWDRRKAALLGKAKTAFNKATTEQSKTVEIPSPALQRGSEMVKQSQPVPGGPKPPGHERIVIAGQIHRRGMANDDKAAKQANERVSGISHKPVIQSKIEKQSKEAAKLREKFRQAAQKEQERGR